ncbi:sigma-70 family RNA polymerase sigma factor [Nonomuraea sp. NPDC050404]|uniref:RNA polymerase sigma factor n=1 Tax=Nonomuraea sp. NPDC050404 TaxID=3155783 RepID=UPI0033FD225C
MTRPLPRLPADDDGEAFAGWYRREFPDLLLFACRLGARWQEAFDLAQEACAKAYPRWSEIGNPGAYIRVSIRNGYYRRTSHDHEVVLSPDLAEPGNGTDAALLEVEFHDQERRIFAAVRGLPPVQREVIAWTIDGYTPTEIAELLDKNPTAVRGNLHKARASLRKSLAGLGGDSV